MGKPVIANQMLKFTELAVSPVLGVVAVMSLCGASVAVAQVTAPPPFELSTEVAPTSRAEVAVASLLSAGGFEEAKIRSGARLASRMSFRAAGAAIALMASADPIVPRRAFGDAGSGVAFLVRLPDVNAGVAPDDPARAPHYALATVVATRLSIWAFFSDVPSDAVLAGA